MDSSDKAPLVGDGSRRRCRPCVLLSLLGLFTVLVLIGGYAVYWYGVVGVRVMSYNTWGMPQKMGSQDKEERMRNIGSMLGQGEYDLVLLEELWMRPDHQTVRQALGPDYTMTEYDDLTTNCDGSATPWGCSGLAIISRFPILHKNFTKFTQQGSISALFSDGEYFAGKGVGQVRVMPAPGLTLDVFVVHTISEDSNAAIRESQADELLAQVGRSDADFIVLGGDFNASPLMEENQAMPDKTYHKVKEVMTDAFQEIMANIKAWLNPDYATFGHMRNTYRGEKEPTIYDYIFHKKNTKEPALIWAKWFDLPFLYATRAADQQLISLSDHEPVTSQLYLWKQPGQK